MKRTLAHEFGHFLDPKFTGVHKNIPFKGNECFEKSTKSSLHRAEDFADWMASQIASSIVLQSGDRSLDLAGTLNFAYSFCEVRSKNPIIVAHRAYRHRAIKEIDGHRSSPERIVALMQEPELLKRIGCKWPLQYKKTIQPYKDCKL